MSIKVPLWIRDLLKRDGSRTLSADWDVGNGRMIQADKVRARDGDGLALYEDGGAGIFVKDGGNVGIGTASAKGKLDIRGDVVLDANRFFGYNTYYSGGFKYLTDGYAGMIKLETTGAFNFASTATSGSADGAAAVSEKMTILKTGNVGIGTTTPAARLHLYGADARLRLQDDENANSYLEIEDVSMGQMTLKKRANTGQALIDIAPEAIDGNSTAIFRFFRTTNTTGSKKIEFYKGDNTAVLHGQIGVGGQNSLFQIGGGYVGIGTAAPGNPLAVNRSADGIIVDFESADTVEGNVSIADNTTSYNAFMGSHYTQLKDGQKTPPVGAIVIATGEIIPCEANIEVPDEVEKGKEKSGMTIITKDVSGVERKEYFSYVELASQKADKRVYGVYHAKLSVDAKGQSFGEDNKAIYQIAALGLYKMRVTDTNGDIAAGNYIQSSIRQGEGEKQDDDVLHNYTVGKAIINVNFSEIEMDLELGYKWQLIPVTLHCG